MMNQEELFKKVGSILIELQDQYNFLAEDPKKLNELELELFLANATFLTDHVNIIRKINGSKIVKEIPQHTAVNPDSIPQNISISEESKALESDNSNKTILNPGPAKEEEFTAAGDDTSTLSSENVVTSYVSLEDLHSQQADLSAAEEVEDSPTEKERDIFTYDSTPATFEFIISDQSLSENKPSDKFEYEEKEVSDIFNRPLSEEERNIIAHKQILRERKELESLESSLKQNEEDRFATKETNEEHTSIDKETEQASIERLFKEVLPPNKLSDDLFTPEKKAKEEPVKPQPIQYTPPVVKEEPVRAKPTYQPEPTIDSPVNKEEAIVNTPTFKEEPVLSKPAFKEEAIVNTPTFKEEPVKPSPAFKQEPIANKPVEASTGTQPPVKLTLNEMLASNLGVNKNINDAGSPESTIADLKQAININQKLVFIKDLFNGYNLAYAEAIELLNKMPDYKTADTFLQNNYAIKNNWAGKQSTTEQFYALLKRRFPAK
jgi:hypothetical protein